MRAIDAKKMRKEEEKRKNANVDKQKEEELTKINGCGNGKDRFRKSAAGKAKNVREAEKDREKIKKTVEKT